jgi:hypothetical protein
VGLGAHLVDAKGKEADCAKHEEELGQGGRGLDRVDVWCPHALDVVVLGDLFKLSPRGGQRVGVTHTRGGATVRYGTYGFTKVYAFLVVPPALRVAELPARRREGRVTHCVARSEAVSARAEAGGHSQGRRLTGMEGGFGIWVVERCGGHGDGRRRGLHRLFGGRGDVGGALYGGIGADGRRSCAHELATGEHRCVQRER